MRKSWIIILALAVAVTVATPPACAQTAPTGWTTQTRDGGARTFVPPGLKAGESYSVTIYNAAALGGKTPEAYLRAFAGPVGGKAGQLSAPLSMLAPQPNTVAARGAYRGPNGAELGAVFWGKYGGDGQISVARCLYSGAGELVLRYSDATRELLIGLGAQAGETAVMVPAAIYDSMKRGGAIMPGTYRGQRTMRSGTGWELNVDLYGNGEYRILRTAGAKVLEDYKVETGEYDYEAGSGKINIGASRFLTNRVSVFGNRYSFFGRDSAGKPFIYAEDEGDVTTLSLVGPTTRLAPRAQNARDAAKAEKERYKFVVAPGKGLQAAQIAAVYWGQTVSSDGKAV